MGPGGAKEEAEAVCGSHINDAQSDQETPEANPMPLRVLYSVAEMPVGPLHGRLGRVESRATANNRRVALGELIITPAGAENFFFSCTRAVSRHVTLTTVSPTAVSPQVAAEALRWSQEHSPPPSRESVHGCLEVSEAKKSRKPLDLLRPFVDLPRKVGRA